MFPITSASDQPTRGEYSVCAKDLDAESYEGGVHSTMTHFVAFTTGRYEEAWVAFHSVPIHDDGEYAQSLESVGTAEEFGASAGCLRARPDDAQTVWGWLDLGDPVVVIS